MGIKATRRAPLMNSGYSEYLVDRIRDEQRRLVSPSTPTNISTDSKIDAILQLNDVMLGLRRAEMRAAQALTRITSSYNDYDPLLTPHVVDIVE